MKRLLLPLAILGIACVSTLATCFLIEHDVTLGWALLVPTVLIFPAIRLAVEAA